MDGRGAPRESHRHRIPLGLVMLEQGWITPGQLRSALEAQKTAGTGRLGHWLVRQQGVKRGTGDARLGLQWSCPVLAMEFHDPEALTALVPRLFVDAFGALPLRVAAGKILYLGFEDRLDPVLALAIERMTGCAWRAGWSRNRVSARACAHARSAVFPRWNWSRPPRSAALAHCAWRKPSSEHGRSSRAGAGARLPVAADVDSAADSGPLPECWIDSRSDLLRSASEFEPDSQASTLRPVIDS